MYIVYEHNAYEHIVYDQLSLSVPHTPKNSDTGNGRTAVRHACHGTKLSDLALTLWLIFEMLLQPGAKLEEEEAKRIFQQVLSAMDYCHRR